MDKDKFYQRPSEASRTKQDIVATYFGAWKNVIKRWRTSPTLAYVDLYSGPGVYADGSHSTPLLILGQAIEDEYLARKLITIFNDDDSQLAAQLRHNIAELHGIERLQKKPEVYEYAVSEKLVRLCPKIPTLLFADPWGYKGLSLALIKGFLSVAGSDCILFFNYRRINAGLDNQAFDEPLDAVFGATRAQELRKKLISLGPAQREETIVDEMGMALREIGAHCAIPYRFKSPTADRTSHHLLFASKHPLGCQIMRQIMNSRSSAKVQGIGNFEFSGQPQQHEQFLLPGFGPLDELGAGLARAFAGQSMTVRCLLAKEHHPTATVANYKAAVLQLESMGIVSVVVPGRERRRVRGALTLPDDAIVTFAREGGEHGRELEH